jgi:DNA excision repair protein ERCC-3
VKNDGQTGLFILQAMRGDLKHALIKAGYPVKDLCGYLDGERFDLSLRSIDLEGNSFAMRDYQKEAVDLFYCAGQKIGGSGVIVLPCGSGKTIIGLGTVAAISSHTLIIATNNVSVGQWRNELLSKTNIKETDIGEFTGRVKEIKPITSEQYKNFRNEMLTIYAIIYSSCSVLQADSYVIEVLLSLKADSQIKYFF